MSKKTVISWLETLLLVLLIFAMLVQCVFFISLTQNNGDVSLPALPESEAKLLISGSIDNVETGKSAVVPYFVGVVSENGRYGGIYDDAAGHEIFGYFVRVIENASGGTAKKVVYSDDEKKYEYLENLYNGAGDCYYVKLKDGIEFSVLCQLMSDTYTGIPESPDFVIEDMFLVGGASDETSITAVDGEGNVLKIYPSKNIPFNNEYIETYNNTEKNEFEFVMLQENVDAGKNCYFPSFKHSIRYNSLLKKSFSEYFDIGAESQDIKELVGIFGMNTDNTRFYKRASDGAMICVEDTTSFEITPSGEFALIAGDSGTNLGKFLDNGVGIDYGFFEYTDIARKIVSSLNEMTSEGCGLLTVEDISYNDGECRFCYSYTVNGVPVEKAADYSLELVFASDSLMSAKGKIEIFEAGDEIKTELPQKTAYVLMDRTRGAVSYFGPEYSYSDDSLNTDRAYMRWIVKYEMRDGGMRE